jgi:hypothetical protein
MPRHKKTSVEADVQAHAERAPAPGAGAAAVTAAGGSAPPAATSTRTLAPEPESATDPRALEPFSGPAYKAVFTSTSKGFELGENRRFKQRVFTFREKPDDATIAALKENGYVYRAAEKAWTTPATAESRLVSDRMAQAFAGHDVTAGRG